MASAVYPKFGEKLLEWALNQTAPAGLAFYVIAVDETYVPDNAHENLANIPGGAIQVPETALANVTIVDGIVNADDVDFSGVTIGERLQAAVIYAKDGGGNSYLAAYIDESSDGSIPQDFATTQGRLVWNAVGIFKV